MRYNSVIPTSALLALRLISASSSFSSSVPAPPSAPSFAFSIKLRRAWRRVSALVKWVSDSSGVESWARYRCGAGEGSGRVLAKLIDARKCYNTNTYQPDNSATVALSNISRLLAQTTHLPRL